jgi:hypothetical protein
VDELHARTGYWVWARAAAEAALHGIPVSDTNLEVKVRWNLVGFTAATPLTDNPDIFPPGWWWDAGRQVYRAINAGGTVRLGAGYWFCGIRPTVLNPRER